MRDYAQELLRGVTDFLLLSLINELPRHGYQIVKELGKRSQGYFKLKSGTIYPVLHRLEIAGLVTSRWQQVTERQRRRYYEITELGRQTLSQRLAEWQSFCTAVGKLMDLGKFMSWSTKNGSPDFRRS